MNVALFHHFPLAGGAPRVLREYVAHSPQHEFTLYTRQPEGPGLMTIDPRVHVRRFPPFADASRIGRLATMAMLPRRGAELAAAIDAGGHDVVFVHASFLVQAPEILPFLRTPNVYYAPEPMRAAYEPEPEFARERSLRGRLVRAGLDPYERRRRALDRRHIRAAARVVTHSRFTARSLEAAYGVTAAVVPLGVDAEAFPPGRIGREPMVLSVGALHPLKGHQFVVEAIAAMPLPRPRLVVVGDRGGLGGALKELAHDRGVELEVHRAIAFERLLDLYHRASVLACGQLREPFGLIALEGMSTGVPVVAVREGGFEETVRDGETGLLVEREPAEFGQALAHVLSDRALARRLSELGQEEAPRWSWERTARGFDAILAQAASSDA